MKSIIKALLRPFCKHRWEQIDEYNSLGVPLTKTYGCRRCGETSEVFISSTKRWKFEQKIEGATFVDED